MNSGPLFCAAPSFLCFVAGPHGLERVLPRNKRLEAFVRTVKALLRTTEPLTLDGEFWPQKDALIALPPYNPDIPPMVGIVGGGGPGAMKIAGRVAVFV